MTGFLVVLQALSLWCGLQDLGPALSTPQGPLMVLGTARAVAGAGRQDGVWTLQAVGPNTRTAVQQPEQCTLTPVKQVVDFAAAGQLWMVEGSGVK